MGLFFEPYLGDQLRVPVVNQERLSIVRLHIRHGIKNLCAYEAAAIIQPGGCKIPKRRLLSW